VSVDYVKSGEGTTSDKDTRTDHSKECKGCVEFLQKPTRKDGKRAVGKAKQPATKKTQSQVAQLREKRTRSQQVHYNLSDDEEGLSDAEDEIQGYLCISADPRRPGVAEGGESFIITVEELRLAPRIQREAGDQAVWMTTTQAGFPTTVTEEELDNDLDRQLGKPTVRHCRIGK